MTDSTDKKSNGNPNRHESLHSRLDSIDKKLKEKQDNLDVDLDALLDEAESTLPPIHEYPDDEDAIDRLLTNAGFDVDDALLQAELEKNEQVVKVDDLHDDLDIFLGFDGFGEDIYDPEKTQPVEKEQILSPESPAIEDEDDALDRLLMNTTLDDTPLQANSDEAIGEFNVDPAQDIASPTDTKHDDIDDDFLGLTDDLDEPDLTAGDDTLLDFANANEQSQSSDTQEAETILPLDNVDGLFNEPDLELDDLTQSAIEEPDEIAEPLSETDDVNDFTDIDLFASHFDESDLVSDDGTLAELSEDNPDIASPDITLDSLSPGNALNDADLSDEIDTLSDIDVADDDFDELDLILDDSTSSELTAISEEPQTIQTVTPDLSDEIDDFSSIDEDFDGSELLQDDETASADAMASEDAEGLANDNDLFIETAFDTEDKPKTEEVDEFGDDADDFFQLDEISDDFSQTTGKAPLAEEESSDKDNQDDDFLLPDFDITAGMEMSDDTELPMTNVDKEIADAFGDNSFLNEQPAFETAEQKIVEPVVDAPNAKQAPDNVSSVISSSSGVDKKQLEAAENKTKKAKLLAYVSLGFAVVALSAAIGLGYMTYAAKSEVAKLTETVTTLETNLAKSAANSPSQEIDTMRNSVMELNQQFDGFISGLKGTPQFPIDLLNDKLPGITASQYMVSKALDMLQVKMGDLEEKAAAASTVAAKFEVAHEPAPPPVKEEVPPVKTEATHEHEHEPASPHEHAAPKEEDEHAPTKERAMHEATTPKPEEAPVAVKVKIPPKPVIKPIAPVKAVPKPEPKPQPIEKKVQEAPPGKWGVNLVAVKHEWYAKTKAAEFARQGIYAEVIPIQSNNATMYRLRVSGFKSKKEADANTAKIKNALNLDKVWVSDN